MTTAEVYQMLSVDRNLLNQDASTSGTNSASKPSKPPKNPKIPKGMSRELFSIMQVDGGLPEAYTATMPATTPVISSDWRKTIRRDKKKKARNWQMASFSPVAKIGAPKFLQHWSKPEDVDKEYPFAKLAAHTFADPLDLPKFSTVEYKAMPPPSDAMENGFWSEDSTRHLFDLVSRFDMRFEIMQYFWEKDKFGEKDPVDLRARFTYVYNYMIRLRNDKKPILPSYDAVTERKRRLQADRLQMRTQEEIDEHATLKEQERKIKLSREERERRQGVIQMRISGLQANRALSTDPRSSASRGPSDKVGTSNTQKIKKRHATTSKKGDKKRAAFDVSLLAGLSPIAEPNLKFPDIRNPGVCARSSRLKLPNSVSTKKSQALKAMLNELKLEDPPMATEDCIDEFNQLRSDLLLLYELRMALISAQTDIAHLKAEIGDRSGDPQIAPLLEKADSALHHTDGEHLISNHIDVTANAAAVRYRRKTTSDQFRSHKND